MATTIGLISLGCSKNRVDSEQMLGFLSAQGYEIVDDPARAEVIIVNTCGFIQSAKEEAISTIFEMAEYKETGKCRLLVATGCFAQRYPEAIQEEMPEVDVIMGVNEYEKIDKAIKEAFAGARPVYTDDDGSFFEFGRVLTTPRYRAYIRIGEGCATCCSYCAIPLIRGGYRSRPKVDIIAEVKRLAAEGVKEFTLIAQDTTRYGTDEGGESKLPELIEEVAAIPGVEWLRALYCYPERVDDRLLDTIARLPNVCNYLDLPMQHISQHILDDMNRTDTTEHIREVVHKFKARGMMLRTTMMLGFPGETEEDFQETLDVVRKVRYDSAFTFIYSRRTGTAAAKMDDQVPDEVAHARLDRLLNVVQKIGREETARFEGQTMPVLAEKVNREDKNLLTGRTSQNTVVHFPGGEDLIGKIVDVKLERCQGFYYLGKMAGGAHAAG